jgi:hypothetical protein
MSIQEVDPYIPHFADRLPPDRTGEAYGTFRDIVDRFDEVEETASRAREIDPDGVLYEICDAFTTQERQRLGRPVPETYLDDLYASELMFADAVLGKLTKLTLNPDLEKIVVLFDLDRTTVALHEHDDPFEDYGYITRPGMGFLVQRMTEIAGEDRLALGVLTDRRSRDPNNQANRTLADRVISQHFPDLPFDPDYIISCTDGELAESLPPHLRKRRALNLPPLAELQIESGQFDFIGGLACQDSISQPEVEYHPKAGVVAALAASNPKQGILWCDDMNATRLINSPQAQGVHVDLHEGMDPLLADDLVRYGSK